MAVCLVTGGAGFIGSHIVEALVGQGDRVRVLDNLSSGHLRNLAHVSDHIEFIEGDVQDKALVLEATAGTELIFHLAALVSVPESMQKPIETELVNAVGTLNVLTGAKATNAQRVVLSSTSAVYGDEPTLPKMETMQPFPKSPYAISKLTAEYYCRLFNEAMGVETATLRYFNVFGPRQDPTSVYSGVISIFVDKIMQNKPPFIYGDGTQTRDFVYVKDVVQANLLAAEVPQAAGKVFNIGTGQQVTIDQLFATLANICNSDLKSDYKPGRPGDIKYSYANVTLARTVLGWSARERLEDGLRQLVASHT